MQYDYSILYPILSAVENPARYVGGEARSQVKPDASFRFALCFPDLYEIGMANQAMRIIYSRINAMEGLACERVFFPKPDFAAGLAEAGLSLYSLESRRPLAEFDAIGFSLGYELALTGVLGILESAGLAPWSDDRGEDAPIIMAGGPATTNPLPYSRIMDCVFIGEAEGQLEDLLQRLNMAKGARSRIPRSEALGLLEAHPAVWSRRKPLARRAVFSGFGQSSSEQPDSPWPLPSIKISQEHGVVEIMRGCPNGCRFCHAGVYYRPKREKDPALIEAEAAFLVEECGYDELSLSSLSSSDYSQLPGLMDRLNARYAARHVSIQLPSLKVESFGLGLLERISAVRRSGLTFAVESPSDELQAAINKRVSSEKIDAILAEAWAREWRLAKFYFMLGLPLGIGAEAEADNIITFMEGLHARHPGFQFNVSLGTFVPKPHTPYQWAGQLGPEEALASLQRIKRSLDRRWAKVSYHDPQVSLLEGIIARGGAWVGDLAMEAYRRGARLDAWEEHFNRQAWEAALSDFADEVKECLSEKDQCAALPWEGVSLGARGEYLQAELEASRRASLSPPCDSPCPRPCGACGLGAVYSEACALADDLGGPAAADGPSAASLDTAVAADARVHRVLVRFEKLEQASFIPHLSMLRVLERSFRMSGLRLDYSKGFNPIPIMELLNPLPVGVQSDNEYVLVDVVLGPGQALPEPGQILCLPQGIRVKSVEAYPYAEGQKKISLQSIYTHSIFELRARTPTDLGLAAEEIEASQKAKIIKKGGDALEVEASGGLRRLFTAELASALFLRRRRQMAGALDLERAYAAAMGV